MIVQTYEHQIAGTSQNVHVFITWTDCRNADNFQKSEDVRITL